MRTVERRREIFPSASRTVGTYTSGTKDCQDLNEGLMFIDVTDVGTGGTLDIVIESPNNNDPGANDWHNALTIPQITTTGRQDVIPFVNLGTLYRVKSVVGTDTVEFKITVSEKVRV